MENLREAKGKEIALTRQIKTLDDGYAVQSQTSKKYYFVDYDGKCTCPDCETRQIKCKHAFAVQFYLQKVSIDENGQTIVQTKRLTYPQAWSAYNKSQQEEKSRFMELLNDLAENPEQGKRSRGQPKISEHDLLFASTLKVYTQFSLRRFMSDLKEAKGKGYINATPCFASVGHFMQKPELTEKLKLLIAVSSAPLKAVETSFAIDSSGFRTTKFNEYCKDKHDTKRKHQYLKAHICTGTKTNIISSVEITDENGADCPQFTPLVQATANNGFSIVELSADKAYSSRENYETVAEAGGQAYIPFKKGSSGRSKGSALWHKMFYYFKLNQEEFYKHYHLRSNAESTFMSIKAKFNDVLKSKSRTAQVNELLLKILCHNIVVVIHETNELGIEAKFN